MLLILEENPQTRFLHKIPLKSIPHNASIENPKSKGIQEIVHLTGNKNYRNKTRKQGNWQPIANLLVGVIAPNPRDHRVNSVAYFP